MRANNIIWKARLVSQNQKIRPRKAEKILMLNHSNKNPFAATLYEFIKHHTNVIQNKPADIEAKKLGSMSRAQFQADKGG